MAHRKHRHLWWKKFSLSPRISWTLLGIVGLFLVMYGLRLASLWQQRTWFGKEPYRILVLHKEKAATLASAEVVSVWPDTGKVVSVSIPNDAFMGVVGGYGTYRLGAVGELGRVEGVGNELLKDSVGFLLGLPIHQVVWQSGSTPDVAHAKWLMLQEGLTGKRSLAEAYEIGRILAQVRGKSIERYELSEKNVLRRQVDVDGMENLHVEPALVDRFVLDNLSTMWREAAMIQVAVVNASGKSQLATQWSRYVRAGGFDLVSVTDQQTKLSRTKIIFSSKELLESVPGRALRSLFPNFVTVEVGDVTSYRAHAAILFGTDSWSWLNERTAYLKK